RGILSDMRPFPPTARSRRTAKGKESRAISVGSDYVRRYPIGAEVMPKGGVHFRVWAPKSEGVQIQLSEGLQFSSGADKLLEMEAEEGGYFSVHVPKASAGMLYKFKLNEGLFSDPASRFQPEGPHGPSQIVDHREFTWTDEKWRGVPRDGQIFYEMHIG